MKAIPGHHPGGNWKSRQRRIVVLTSILMLALGTGCTSWHEYIANGFKVGPNYRRPATPVADQWIDSAEPGLNTEATPTGAWWCSFHDPVLDALISSAYEQNLTLRVAGLRILEARAQRAIAAGNLFPQAQQAFGDYTRIGISKNGPSALTPTNFLDEWRLGGTLAWELDFWGRFRRSIEAADANMDASIENYDDALVLLLAEVARSYTDVRIAEQRLAYARQNVKIQQGSLRIAEDRLRNGVTTQLDVSQAESDLANTEASIPLLEAARRQSVNQLCILLGMPPQNLDELLAAHSGIPNAPAEVAVGIPAELLRRRPDVRRAEREVAAQSAQIGIATSELYPHFSITGTVYLDATKFEDLFDADSIAGAVGPSFQWNLLNYGRLVNNIRVQEARFQQLAVQYQNTVLQANAEAENAIVAFLKAQQQAKSLAQSAEAARQSVELVLAQYREGTVDFNRVFSVQQFLTQQQDQLAVAEGTIAQNLIELYRALGGGWQIRLNAPAPQPLAGPGPAADIVPAPDPDAPPELEPLEEPEPIPAPLPEPAPQPEPLAEPDEALEALSGPEPDKIPEALLEPEPEAPQPQPLLPLQQQP